MTSCDDDSSLKSTVKKDNSQNKDEKKGTDNNGDGRDGLEWGSDNVRKKEEDFSDIYMNQKKPVTSVTKNDEAEGFEEKETIES